MSDVSDLYQDVILDHSRTPRNYRVMPAADRTSEGFNPLCGDQVTVYVKLNGDRIDDVSFQGQGCAISKSSSSIMTGLVKGKTIAEAQGLFDRFHALVTGTSTEAPAEDDKMAVFAGVAEFPSRVKCASLVWHTLARCLSPLSTGDGGPVKTE